MFGTSIFIRYVGILFRVLCGPNSNFQTKQGRDCGVLWFCFALAFVRPLSPDRMLRRIAFSRFHVIELLPHDGFEAFITSRKEHDIISTHCTSTSMLGERF